MIPRANRLREGNIQNLVVTQLTDLLINFFPSPFSNHAKSRKASEERINEKRPSVVADSQCLITHPSRPRIKEQRVRETVEGRERKEKRDYLTGRSRSGYQPEKQEQMYLHDYKIKCLSKNLISGNIIVYTFVFNSPGIGSSLWDPLCTPGCEDCGFLRTSPNAC